MSLRRRDPARLAERAAEFRAQGFTREADRIEADLARKPARLRAIRKGSSRAGWQAMRARVIAEQGGRCAMGGHLAFRLDLAHLEPLGMGRSRHDDDHALNARANVVALCRRHHEELDAMPEPARSGLVARLKAAIELADKGGHGARRGL